MADAEIQPAAEQVAAPEQPATDAKDAKQKKSGKKAKSEKPDDAVKLGCGGFFRRKRKNKQSGKEAAGGQNGEGDAAASKAPVEKPAKAAASPVKGTVKMEESPQGSMWSNIVSNSMVGTGAFRRAAVCSLATGGVLACCPATFTPSVEQVAALRDNFANRGVFSAAGFGVAGTVFQLQEETGTEDTISGADSGQTEGVLVTRSNTALLIGTFAEKLDLAMETLNGLRTHFVEQGL